MAARGDEHFALALSHAEQLREPAGELRGLGARGHLVEAIEPLSRTGPGRRLLPSRRRPVLSLGAGPADREA